MQDPSKAEPRPGRIVGFRSNAELVCRGVKRGRDMIVRVHAKSGEVVQRIQVPLRHAQRSLGQSGKVLHTTPPPAGAPQLGALTLMLDERHSLATNAPNVNVEELKLEAAWVGD